MKKELSEEGITKRALLGWGWLRVGGVARETAAVTAPQKPREREMEKHWGKVVCPNADVWVQGMLCCTAALGVGSPCAPQQRPFCRGNSGAGGAGMGRVPPNTNQEGNGWGGLQGLCEVGPPQPAGEGEKRPHRSPREQRVSVARDSSKETRGNKCATNRWGGDLVGMLPGGRRGAAVVLRRFPPSSQHRAHPSDLPHHLSALVHIPDLTFPMLLRQRS